MRCRRCSTASTGRSARSNFPPDRFHEPRAASHRYPRCGAVSFRERSAGMDWERIAGNWKEFKGRLRQRWGELTDDEWNVIAGHREQLIGQIQQRYSITAEEAERQVAEFEKEEE